MLKYNPKQRYSPEQCLDDDWFKKYATTKSSKEKGEEAVISSIAIQNMKHFKVAC